MILRSAASRQLDKVAQGNGTDPQNRVSYRSGGESTSPHLSDLSTCLSCVKSKPRWSQQFRTMNVGHLPIRLLSPVGKARLMYTSTETKSQPLVTPGFKSLTVADNQRLPSHVWMLYFLPSEWTVNMFFKRTFSGSLTIKVLQFLSLTVCVLHD